MELMSVLILLPGAAIKMAEMLHNAAVADMFELNITVAIPIKQQRNRGEVV